MAHSVFKWVHLSDLHFYSSSPIKDGFNSAELKRTLPEYLKKIRGVDAMILTGDYRYAPKRDENPKGAADYIKKLSSALGLKSEQVYLVPGNHDLKRSLSRTDTIHGLRKDYNTRIGTFDQERLENLRKGFSYFDELCRAVYAPKESPYFAPPDNPHYLVELEQCNLLMLNTALTAGALIDGKANDEHKLLLGSSFLAAANEFAKDKKPTIAIGHHGLQFLEDNEQEVCAQYFKNNGVGIYLCGHAHHMGIRPFGGNGQEITAGCLIQNDKSVDAAFFSGSLMSDGRVEVTCHKWDAATQSWYEHMPMTKSLGHIYSMSESADAADGGEDDEAALIDALSLKGYVLLGGRGIDGIKYIWEKNGKLIESLAFNRRLKDTSDPDDFRVSAYTSSVSYGCPLSQKQQQCVFCETGQKSFQGHMKAEDIALQNIFMASYDSDCPSFPQVRKNKREFAFMGQGEPGLCYPSVRRAILITDCAMKIIGQEVTRYIISTSGIKGLATQLAEDIQKGTYPCKVALHYSLHAIGEDRSMLMPVNLEHSCLDFIKECENLYCVTGEKIGVGILMFYRYRTHNRSEQFTLTVQRLGNILRALDPTAFRIDLCDVNRTSCGSQPALSNERATQLLNYVKGKGFEGKLFSSFGDNEQSGCGMLSSLTTNISNPGDKTLMHYKASLALLKDAIAAAEE